MKQYTLQERSNMKFHTVMAEPFIQKVNLIRNIVSQSDTE